MLVGVAVTPLAGQEQADSRCARVVSCCGGPDGRGRVALLT